MLNLKKSLFLEWHSIFSSAVDIIHQLFQTVRTVSHSVIVPALFQLVLGQKTNKEGLSDVRVKVRTEASNVEAYEELTNQEVRRDPSLNQVADSDPVDDHHGSEGQYYSGNKGEDVNQ